MAYYRNKVTGAVSKKAPAKDEREQWIEIDGPSEPEFEVVEGVMPGSAELPDVGPGKAPAAKPAPKTRRKR